MAKRWSAYLSYLDYDSMENRDPSYEVQVPLGDVCDLDAVMAHAQREWTARSKKRVTGWDRRVYPRCPRLMFDLR